MWRAVREWYIVGIGVLLIAGGLTLAAHQSSPPPAINQAAVTAPDQTTPAAKTATRTAQQAAPGTASGIPAPRVTAAAVPAEQSPVSTAPAAPAAVAAAQTTAPSPAPLSHDHATPSAASETSAQAPPTPSASPASGGDPVAGRLVFRKCQACHSLEPGKNILGPSLAGIVGRKAGAEPGYSYSPALKQADIVWDAQDARFLSRRSAEDGSRKQDAVSGSQDRTRPRRRDCVPRPVDRRRATGRSRTERSAARRAGACGGSRAATRRNRPNAAEPAELGHRLRRRRQLHIALGHRRGPHGLYRGRRSDRRKGQSDADCGGRSGGPAHLDQWRGRRARHRLSRPGHEIAARDRKRREHDDCFPRHQIRRLHLFLQRARTPTRGHAGAVHRHPAAGAASGGRSRHFARARPTCRRRSPSASRRPCASTC